MSSLLPSPSNDYAAPQGDARLNKAFWDAALTSVGARIRALEALKTTWEDLIAEGTGQALEVIQANVAPQLAVLTATINALKADVAAAEDAIAVITAGGVAMSNVAGLSAALALLAPIASPKLTGAPEAPTAAIDADSNQIVNVTALRLAVANLVGAAPGALDTLIEMSNALGGDPNFNTTILNALAGKQPFSAVLSAITALAVAADVRAGTSTSAVLTPKSVRDAMAAVALPFAASMKELRQQQAEIVGKIEQITSKSKVPEMAASLSAPLRTQLADVNNEIRAIEEQLRRLDGMTVTPKINLGPLQQGFETLRGIGPSFMGNSAPSKAGAGPQSAAPSSNTYQVSGYSPGTIARRIAREERRAAREAQFGALHDIGALA